MLPQAVYDTPIEALDLSPRAYNSLKRAGVSKVGEVLDMTEEDLLNVRNFGRKSLDELRDRLILKNFLTPERAQEQFGGAYHEEYEFANGGIRVRDRAHHQVGYGSRRVWRGNGLQPAATNEADRAVSRPEHDALIAKHDERLDAIVRGRRRRHIAR